MSVVVSRVSERLRSSRRGAPWAELTHRRRVAVQWMLAGPFALSALFIAVAVLSGFCGTFGQECSPEQQRDIDLFGIAAVLVLLPGPICHFLLRRRLSSLLWLGLLVVFLLV